MKYGTTEILSETTRYRLERYTSHREGFSPCYFVIDKQQKDSCGCDATVAQTDSEPDALKVFEILSKTADLEESYKADIMKARATLKQSA